MMMMVNKMERLHVVNKSYTFRLFKKKIPCCKHEFYFYLFLFKFKDFILKFQFKNLINILKCAHDTCLLKVY